MIDRGPQQSADMTNGVSALLSHNSNSSTRLDTTGMLSALLHPPSDTNHTMRFNSNMSDSSLQCMSAQIPGTVNREGEKSAEKTLFASSLPAVSSTRSEETSTNLAPREIMAQRWQ